MGTHSVSTQFSIKGTNGNSVGLGLAKLAFNNSLGVSTNSEHDCVVDMGSEPALYYAVVLSIDFIEVVLDSVFSLWDTFLNMSNLDEDGFLDMPIFGLDSDLPIC